MSEILNKYKWMGPIIDKMDSDIKRIFMKNFRMREKNFFPKGDYKADVKNLVNWSIKTTRTVTLRRIKFFWPFFFFTMFSFSLLLQSFQYLQAFGLCSQLKRAVHQVLLK